MPAFDLRHGSLRNAGAIDGQVYARQSERSNYRAHFSRSVTHVHRHPDIRSNNRNRDAYRRTGKRNLRAYRKEQQMTYIPTYTYPDLPEECEGEKCPDCGGCSRYLRDTDNTGDFELYECDECGRQFERYNPIPF